MSEPERLTSKLVDALIVIVVVTMVFSAIVSMLRPYVWIFMVVAPVVLGAGWWYRRTHYF